jgi:hypothetical protein
LYAGLLPLINSQRIELFDLSSLIGQTCALERSTRHGAAEKIDHPPRGRDDVVNAVAGAAALCLRASGYSLETLKRATAWGDEDEALAEPSWAERERQRHYDELLQRYGQPVSLNPLPRG